jgi:DNA-directed RNA polymerase subunit RPC12/RpoP
MRVLSAKCPHCQAPVDIPSKKLGEPIECPQCNSPFTMEVPTAEVSRVHEISDEQAEEQKLLAHEVKERTLLKTHPVMFRAHPFYFAGLTVLLALGLFGAGYGGYIGTSGTMWGGVALLAIVALVFLIWWVGTLAVTLTVTEARTILKKGLISRETSEVQHDDVRNIQLDQSMFERIFHVGDIGISSSGQDDLEIVAHSLPSPDKIVELIRANQD